MKIAFLSFYSGIVERGVEVFVQELSERLAKKFEVIVFVSRKTSKHKKFQEIPVGDNKYKASESVGWLRRLFLDFNSRRICQFSLQSLSLAKKMDVDIIVPLNGGWQTVLVKMFCLLYHKKFVVSGHAGIGWDDRFNLLCTPNLFVALSDRGFFWAQRTAPWVKLVKIPDGVDISQFAPGKAAKVDLEKPIIVCVSALDKYKRIETTIRAVRLLPKASLLLLGKGDKDEEKEIDNMGNKLLGAKRYLRLVVPHAAMPGYYNAAGVFTLVSQSQEAFGMVYLEAMACNLPVVVTDDLTRREVVRLAGIFVKNPEDLSEYSQKLSLALKTNFGSKPRQQAKQYSWERIGKKYEKMFENL